jgi:hypothetical protein
MKISYLRIRDPIVEEEHLLLSEDPLLLWHRSASACRVSWVFSFASVGLLGRGHGEFYTTSRAIYCQKLGSS